MQFIMDCLNVNEKGHLQMSGCDLVEVAERFGTPAYVLDEATVRKNCRAYVDSIKKYYGGNGLALYASKALSCKYMYRLIAEEGMGADVVSGGEIYTALSSGFPAERLYFHGNNKTLDELEYAIKCGVGRIVADNRTELERINKIAGELGVCVKVIIRITPGVDAHTHSFIKTGQIDSKFGAILETGEADEIVGLAASMENIEVTGFHCHIGSQIFELAPFELAAEIMMNFIADMREKHGVTARELDLGGGFGIKYTEKDTPIDYGEYMHAVSKTVKRVAAERDIPLPFIIVEPGRSVVAEAGLTLYTVGTIKEIPGIRTYVSIDGGMTDNPRYILYQSEYTAVSAENPEALRNSVITLAGKCCESGDLIGENMEISKLHTGEIVAVLSTGAYNYSMASNYNRIPRPPVLFAADGEIKTAVRRETYEDMLICDM